MTVVIVMQVGLVLTLLSVFLFRASTSELNFSGRSQRTNTAAEAAEAGVEDYIAKLTEDHLYFLHFVHPGESTRRNGSTTRGPGTAWNGTTTWTYPLGRTGWRTLANGYQYNLQISPPTAGSPGVRVVATGRRAGSTDEWRTIEAFVRPALISDFQMVANRDIGFGPTATTRGKLYAGIDSSNVKHSIWHDGNAYADLYAEGSIAAAPTYHDGAKGYGSSTIRTKIKNPVNFNTFTSALVDVQQAASAGLSLNVGSVHAWKLVFQSNGNVTYYRCTRSGSNNVASVAPTCNTPVTRAVPANGAIYTQQTAIVEGTVNGRVTLASNADVVISNNLSYAANGSDVFGLIARNNVYVAQYVPSTLSIRCSLIAQTGEWRSWGSSGTHGTFTHTGSAATNLGGGMSQFTTRNYVYDTNLMYLQPPYYPVLEEAYTVPFFRAVRPGTT